MVSRCAVLLLALGVLAAAEVRLEIETAVQPGQLLQLSVITEGTASPGTELVLPATPGITWHDQKLVAQASQSGTNRPTTYARTWRVLAGLDQRERWELPPLTVRLQDGRELRSEARVLTPTEADERLRGEFFCEVAFDPPVVVPGQTVELVYHIALRDPRGIDLDDGIGVRLPEHAITLGESRVATKDTVYDAMGEPWTRLELRLPFTVSEPGSYEIGGQQGFVRTVQDRFGFQRGRRSVATVPIRPGTLEVTTLPSAGRPDDFSGLIGAVTIEPELERTTIALGEGTGYTVTVRGHMLELLGALPPPEIPGLRARLVDDHELEDGAHRYEYNLEPERVGSFAVSPPNLTFFEPETRSYRETRAATLTLEVLPGRQRTLSIAGDRTADPDAEPTADEQRPGLPPPLHGAGLHRPDPRWGWLMLGAGALAGMAGGLGLRALGRWQRRPRRSEDLRRAITARDPAAIDRQLHLALADCRDPERRAALNAAIAAVEHVRFGHGQLDDELIARLEALR